MLPIEINRIFKILNQAINLIQNIILKPQLWQLYVGAYILEKEYSNLLSY